MDELYWKGYFAEQLRLDARKCSVGYACGNTCIPVSKSCQKNPKASSGKERLKRIHQLAERAIPEGRGLGRLRQSEAAAKAKEIQTQRDQQAKDLLAQRLKSRPASQTLGPDQLKKIGGSEWRKGDQHRYYFNDLSNLHGLRTSRHKSGSVSSASLNGEKISNSEAKRILESLDRIKVWYDVNKQEFTYKTTPNPMDHRGYDLEGMAKNIVNTLKLKAQGLKG